jgi:plasmid stabilization system protein ParE
MKVDLTPTARTRLREITIYLVSENPFAAEKMLRTIDRSIDRLASFPRLGHPVPEFPDMQLRQLIVHPYRIFFVVYEAQKTVWVVDVWHGAQIPSRPKLPTVEPESAGR